MLTRIKMTFLILVLTQGLHSIEEYIGRLWEVYPPAKFLCGLIYKNHETGFLIINIGFFIFGLLCWFFTIRRNQLYAQGLIWCWIVMEIINVIGHVSWAISERAYVPGVATAPVLLVVALYLLRQLVHANSKLLSN
jgi:uncharacterized protein with HXXEE motif